MITDRFVVHGKAHSTNPQNRQEDEAMTEVRKGSIDINDETVKTLTRTIGDRYSGIRVTAGTNGISHCADRSGGSRAYVALDTCKGDMMFHPIRDESGEVSGIEIACCGDSAMTTLLNSLHFVIGTLARMGVELAKE